VSDPRPFYDGLADLYHFIYADWEKSIETQAAILDEIIRTDRPEAKLIADVACGIGTQALGLARRNYEVIASDISEQAIDRARREASTRGLRIDFRLDDMLRLSTYKDQSVDVLIACDNAIPHLLSDGEIASAFGQFRRVIKPGGTCIISVRDYAIVGREPMRFVPYGVRTLPKGTMSIFQLWEWEGDQYNLNMYFVGDDGAQVDTRVLRARYYAVSIVKLIDLFTKVGFVDVRRIDDLYFQPLIVARLR